MPVVFFSDALILEKIAILGQPPRHTQTFCFADNGKAFEL